MTDEMLDVELEASVRDGRLAVIACGANGDAVGWASMSPLAPHRIDDVDVYVVSRHRARGVGAALLDGLVGEGARHGVRYLRWVHPDLPVARRLVERVGAACARKVVAGRSTDVLMVPAA